jgi:squalene synthase HpnC
MPVDHYENFPVASILLPRSVRRPVELIYRFAREADDLADEGPLTPAARLEALDLFARQLEAIRHARTPEIAWFGELGEIVRRHRLPVEAFEDLLSAFRQDVTQHRYATFDDVLDYCRRSANPVGRLLLVLYGVRDARAHAWSDSICSSLQLINFVYFPLNELERFGLTEHDIAQERTGPRWEAFMRFQIGRARSMLLAGLPLGRLLTGRLGLEMRMIIAGGARILEKIERVHGDVFTRRPVLQATDWPLMFVRALRT